MKKLSVSFAIAALAASQALAVPTSITDTTPGTATRDGTIGGGEYVGSSTGINSGFGNIIGSSSTMYIDSDTLGNLNIGFSFGGGTWNDAIVIYIDSTGGGFADTSGFTDTSDPLRGAISGLDGGNPDNRSTLVFASGFEADYAIAMNSGFAGLWQLQNGVAHTFAASADLVNPNVSTPEIEISLSDIGLNVGDSFRYVATYVSTTGFRSDEYHGVAQQSFTQGWETHTLASGDFNTFQTIPEPGTMAFMALGAAGLLYRRVRAKKA